MAVEAVVIPVLLAAGQQLLAELSVIRTIKKSNPAIVGDIEAFTESLKADLNLVQEKLKSRTDDQTWAIESLEEDLEESSKQLQKWRRQGLVQRYWDAKKTRAELSALREKLSHNFQVKLAITSIEVLIDKESRTDALHSTLLQLLTATASRSDVYNSTDEIKNLLKPLTSGRWVEREMFQQLRADMKELAAAFECTNDNSLKTQKFLDDILGALATDAATTLPCQTEDDAATALPQQTEDETDYCDPFTYELMCDPVKCADGLTYDRFSVFRNNTEIPGKPLFILCDDLNIRRRLFEKFHHKGLDKLMWSKRNSYKTKALEVAKAGQFGEALESLDNVLQWAPKDSECLQMREKLRSSCRNDALKLAENGQHAEARIMLEKVLKWSPSDLQCLTTYKTIEQRVAAEVVVGPGEIISTAENQPVDDPQTGKITWRMENFSKVDVRKLHSDSFVVGGCKWRVLLYPKGNNVDHLSVYLDVADSATLPYGWSISTRFSLSVINQFDLKATVNKEEILHQFNVRDSDWGFTSFVPLQELYDPSRGFLVNDTLIVEADVTLAVFHVEVFNWEEKEWERKENADAHLYTIIRVARDDDLEKQIGKNIHFDLVDHDKVRSCRMGKQTVFAHFKEEVARELGIPVICQRFWLWAKRQNHTYRPNRPLNEQEENQTVGRLRKALKFRKSELKLFLEVPITFLKQGIAAFPSEKTEEDILLFFKLYNPETEELRYVGRTFVKAGGNPADILDRLNEMAGFAPSDEISLYEEIRFEPNVMCKHIDLKSTFSANQLGDGDIICYQRASSKEDNQNYRFTDVPSFLKYVRSNTQVIHFRHLENPKEDEFCLELSMQHTYDEVVEKVAQQLGLEDASKIRLTSHKCYLQQPKPQPIQYRGLDRLSDMLVDYNQTSDILYFETLDLPPPELQGLKTLRFAFHNAKTEQLSVHNIRLPKQSTIGDVITELKGKVELSSPKGELRILKVFHHKIYQIFPSNEKIEKIDDQFWTLRAEEIPEEEKDLGSQERLIHVYHFTRDASQNYMPFLLVVREHETLLDIKKRIRKKLQIANEEFEKWKFAFLSSGRPEYLQDQDIVASRSGTNARIFPKIEGLSSLLKYVHVLGSTGKPVFGIMRSLLSRQKLSDTYTYGAFPHDLGLEHAKSAPKRLHQSNQNRHGVLEWPRHHLAQAAVLVLLLCFLAAGFFGYRYRVVIAILLTLGISYLSYFDI